MSFKEVCTDCGMTANNMTCIKKYGRVAKKPAFDVSTFHKGICDVCGKEKYVTEARDFFYPDERAFKYLKNYLAKVTQAKGTE